MENGKRNENKRKPTNKNRKSQIRPNMKTCAHIKKNHIPYRTRCVFSFSDYYIFCMRTKEIHFKYLERTAQARI